MRYKKLNSDFQELPDSEDSYPHILDTKTNLIWQSETHGKMNWDSAMSLEKEGWRVPTIDELNTIVDRTRYQPACDSVFKAASKVCWSSSPIAYDNSPVRSTH